MTGFANRAALYIGAALYAASLLVAWFASLLVLSIVILACARNRRRVIVSIVPFTVAIVRTLSSFRPTYFIVFAALTGQLAPGGVISLDAAGPLARVYGEYLFCLVFVLYVAVGLPRAYGLPLLQAAAQAAPRDAIALAAVRVFGAAFIGSVIISYRGPYGVVGGLMVLAYGLLLSWLTISAVARQRSALAPSVTPSTVRPAGQLVFLQISDMHVTSLENRIPMGGGRSGVAELRELARSMDEGALDVPVAIVSGDMVDSGAEKEWTLADEPLQKMKRHSRVVLAPGNHDILPSYSPFGLFWAAIFPGGGPVIDGVLVRRFFDRAAAIEPALTTCAGQLLHEYLKAWDRPWTKLRQQWDDARAKAIADLGLPPTTRHPVALRRYKSQRPAAADLEGRFIASAQQLYPELESSYWQRNLYVVGPDAVAEFFAHGPWNKQWYVPFPLRLTLVEQGLEILILNSNPPKPLIAQSSIGQCGDEQLDRLKALLDASTAPTVLVVHHHAPASWKGDRFNFGRWATLAHDPKEGRRLFALLANASRDNRQIFLLTGHTHEVTRLAFFKNNDASPDDGEFCYLESAALGEPDGVELLAGVRDSLGRVQATVTSIPRRAST